MSSSRAIAAVLAATGIAASAAAQDSTAINTPPNGLPGDALFPFDTTEQCNAFVVDLQPFLSCFGARFAVAPIIKTSKSDPGQFFSSLSSAYGISNDMIRTQFPTNVYSVWNMAGFGVNGDPNLNTPPTSIGVDGPSSQFGVVFSEFGGLNHGGIVSGVVNFRSDDPLRLYVNRVLAATAQVSATVLRSASFGVGAVDANGNVHFRADGNNSNGPMPLTGNNYFRVDTLGRNCALVNSINNAGGADALATERPLNNSGVTHSTPTILPESIAGRPVMLGTNFNGQYTHESAPLVMSTTTAHRTGTADQRGTMAFNRRLLFPNSVGTGASLTKSTAAGNTDTMTIWGVTNNGSVTANRNFTFPGSVSDPCGNFTLMGNVEFDHYHSQVPFNGGNGQIAIGKDRQGRGLVACTADDDNVLTGNDNPCNAIVVARFDPTNPGGPVQWTLAAWLDCFTSTGKLIYEFPGGPVKGRIAALVEQTGGAPNPIGPSISAPAFDAAGNIWFTSPVKFFGPDGMEGGTDDDVDTCLIRGVYNPTNFCYDLDVVLCTGNVFQGRNSDRKYQIRFIETADFNSISSGAFWSGAVTAGAWDNRGGALEPTNPRALGGLVLMAEIVYDVNQDGIYEKVTGATGNPASPDQEYNVMLYVSAAPCNPADLDGNGVVDGVDLAFFLGGWGLPGITDLNGDGTTDGVDLAFFLGSWGPC